MILTYDLSRSPPTYDFVGALLTMEIMRLQAGADHIDIRFNPGPVGGFRRDHLPPDLPERQRMFDNIVKPTCWMLPSVRSVEMGQSDTSVGHGTHLILRALRQGVRPLRTPESPYQYFPPIQGKAYASITLREADYWPERNSDLAEWCQLADWLKSFGLMVIFIRDTAKAGIGIEGQIVSSNASSDLNRRAALYQGATLNLFTNNGPAWFCAALNAPTFIWRMLGPSPATTAEFFARVGLPVNSQIPGMTICWGDDPYPQLREVLNG